jgi:hypothetical protein
MGKCPICGSDGDDLVFRFYCSNGECANYVPPKEEQNPDGGILAKGEVFRLGKPEFIGRFSVRNAPFSPELLELLRPGGKVSALCEEFEFLRRRILEGLGMPKEFFDNDDRPYPLFDLVKDPVGHQVTLRWLDRVPEALNVFIEPILESRIGEPMTENARLSMRDEIVRDLLRMCARNELFWSRYRNRWELHFTE